MKKTDVPIWEKITLTIEECSDFSGIGINTLRELCKSKECDFVLQIGTKKLIKRKKFEAFIENRYVI